MIQDSFDIHLISLPEREDRRRECRKQWERSGIDWSRVKVFPGIRPAEAGGFPNIGARGCWMSHHAVLRSQMNATRPILVCEDDLNFARDFESRWSQIHGVLKAEPWSFFYGSAHHCGQPAEHMGVRKPAAFLTLNHMIALHPKVIAPLVDYLDGMLTRPPDDPKGGPMHVDYAYAYFRRDYPQHITRVAVPELGYQRATKSSIQTWGWHDRVPGLRLAADPLRMVKNWLRDR